MNEISLFSGIFVGRRLVLLTRTAWPDVGLQNGAENPPLCCDATLECGETFIGTLPPQREVLQTSSASFFKPTMKSHLFNRKKRLQFLYSTFLSSSIILCRGYFPLFEVSLLFKCLLFLAHHSPRASSSTFICDILRYRIFSQASFAARRHGSPNR